MFWVTSVYFNLRNTLPKFGTFLLGHPVYIYIYIYIYLFITYSETAVTSHLQLINQKSIYTSSWVAVDLISILMCSNALKTCLSVYASTYYVPNPPSPLGYNKLSLGFVCSCTVCSNVPTHWGQLVLQTAWRHPYCPPPRTFPLNTLEKPADVEITEQRTMEELLTSCLQHSGTSVYMLRAYCLKRTELPSL